MDRRIVVIVLVSLLLHVNVVQSRGGRGGGGRGGGRSGGSISGSSSGGKSSGSSGSNRVRGGGQSRYLSGTGVGSKASGNNFKTAITGAAAGYLTYRAGRAMIRIPDAPMLWNGRAYYWNSAYYSRRDDLEMCSMPLDASDPAFANVFYKEGSRPKQIVWGCKAFEEDCCGMECCPQASEGISTIWIVIGGIALLLLFCCCCCCCYGFCTELFGKDAGDANKQYKLNPEESKARAISAINRQNDFDSNSQDKRQTVVFLQTT